MKTAAAQMILCNALCSSFYYILLHIFILFYDPIDRLLSLRCRIFRSRSPRDHLIEG